MRAIQKFALLCTASLIFLGGCTIAKIGGKGAIPVMLNQPQSKVEVIEDLEVSKMISFDYTGFYDISKIVSKAIEGKKADAVINCQITLKMTMGSYFLNVFTLGLANSKVVEISGQLVKLPQGLGALGGGVPLAEINRLATPNGGSYTILLR